MCKKVLIATLAVVVALAVVKGSWLASHVRCWKQQLTTAIDERIPPEQEIARLEMELTNLAREDDKHFDKVARQAVEVANLEKKVTSRKKKLTEAETKIRSLRTTVSDDRDALVRLRGLAAQFEADELTLKSMEEELTAKRQAYNANHKKLSEMRLVRQQMKTELQRLKTALVVERQAQAQEANTLDDAEYIKARKDLDSLRNKIDVLKKKRELKAEVQGFDAVSEERREQDARLDKFIEKRFGSSADKH